MKIKSLQISNVLSFKYVEDISSAQEIKFDDGLNILIGENGSGKSTALEVLNFIFKRVLLTQFNVNQDSYSKRSDLSQSEKKNILLPENSKSYKGFRLDANWDSEDKPQKIRLKIELDEIDSENIKNLTTNKEKLDPLLSYTTHPITLSNQDKSEYIVEVTLNKDGKTFSVSSSDNSDFGYLYLVNYNFYKELINFYNRENSKNPIVPLYESFTLIGGYRNYNTFTPTISLSASPAAVQIQEIRKQDYSRSLNVSEQAQPAIFGLVRLRVAEKHYNIFDSNLNKDECETEANKLPFLLSINKKLKLVNLECRIRLSDRATWQYAFEFFDIKRNRFLADINSLSAGQKAIIHLVFEAYGRGELKGGLVIIDEPEIHLHYQFQNEYLRVIE